MNLTDMKALLARHGVRLSKRLGQNFLIADWVPKQIAEAAGLDPKYGVLEIGPGVGSLTIQLSQRAGRVAAVELDQSLLPVLAETLAGCSNVTVISGDILKLHLPALISDLFPDQAVKVCANLPYNITSPVITKLLESGCFESITVMVQREVARRICAKPGDSDCGAFSLLCQYYADCKLLFDVEPSCFFPPPKVTSTVLTLTPRSAPVVEGNPDAIFKVVRAAFQQRRKTLLNALTIGYQDHSKDQLRQIILDCGFPEDVRGERLGLEEFAKLANMLGTNHL